MPFGAGRVGEFWVAKGGGIAVAIRDILPLEAGAFYLMDRGYLDCARRNTMHQAGAFFVTRAKSNFNARRVYSAKVDKATGVVCDQSVRSMDSRRPKITLSMCAGFVSRTQRARR